MMIKAKVQIAPSVLSADFGRLNEEIAMVEPYSQRIHFDVMDGHFVPNISFGASIMKWLKTALPIDAHLMIENPWLYLEDFVKAGASVIIVHQEACRQSGKYSLGNVLKKIKLLGVRAGVSIKPKTPVRAIMGVLDLVDQVLIMTVEPGFGGQVFMPKMLGKVRTLSGGGFKGDIAVDGGVNEKTARLCVAAGANILVAGNYIFRAKDRVKVVKALWEV